MTQTAFDGAVALVLDLEGGYVEDPRDPGGATKFGITRTTLGTARGRPVAVADVKALTRAEAAAIYRRLYWTAVEADRLPAGLDLAVFDYAVNSGPSRALRSLQAALGAPVDGRFGDVTAAAALAASPTDAIRALSRIRLAFLRSLPTWPAFGRGWMARVERVERAALAAAARPAAAPIGSAPAPRRAPQGEKENTMDKTKTILASRTVWANLIGLVSVGLGLAGVKTGSIDANGLADAASQIVAGASFVASTIFRVTATKQIASTPN